MPEKKIGQLGRDDYKWGESPPGTYDTYKMVRYTEGHLSSRNWQTVGSTKTGGSSHSKRLKDGWSKSLPEGHENLWNETNFVQGPMNTSPGGSSSTIRSKKSVKGHASKEGEGQLWGRGTQSWGAYFRRIREREVHIVEFPSSGEDQVQWVNLTGDRYLAKAVTARKGTRGRASWAKRGC